ncbi:VIT1/CCC1 transporter family protein [Candidatus Kaiserbacteria bacterium]|nr:VIT1/CCC1 transporter family protein [Candidatus Kaiserbacteria bacterium]
MAARYSNRASSLEKFFPNVVLGFNDALISLTGALAGFFVALREPNVIAVAGLITGISAALSMAASAYQQARHERRREALKAALVTGVSYLAVALLLTAPFMACDDITIALTATVFVAVALVAVVAFYSSRLLGRRYSVQFFEMCAFSLGIAILTFFIGEALDEYISS